jgi:hypothetical protein
MSPSFSTTARAARPWLAAALMLALCLTATPARCDSGPGALRLAASTLAGPGWQWLQQLWSSLDRWLPGAFNRAQDPQTAPNSHQGRSAPNTSPSDASGGSDDDSAGGGDPNG